MLIGRNQIQKRRNNYGDFESITGGIQGQRYPPPQCEEAFASGSQGSPNPPSGGVTQNGLWVSL
jgi:hypothetical protein